LRGVLSAGDLVASQLPFSQARGHLPHLTRQNITIHAVD
jgi:hypothetical protein